MANANIIVSLVDKATASLKNIESQVKKFESSANKTNSTLTKMESNVKKVGAAIAAGFGGKAVATTAANFEDLRDSLNAVFGDVTKGAQAFNFVTDYATQTQFTVGQLTETLIKLKANGVDPTNYGLESTADLLTLFTDTAAITTDQLGSLQAMADLFSRTTAGGLGLEDLNRLADRGVPVFAILNEKLGLTRLELSEVGKSSEGARILLTALAEGINEQFGGATLSRMDNLSTATSNFGVAIDLVSDRFVSKMSPALAEFINSLSKFISVLNPVTDLIAYALGGALTVATAIVETITEYFNYFLAAITGISAAFRPFILKLKDATKGMEGMAVPVISLLALLARLNPVVAAVTAAFAAIGYVKKHWEEFQLYLTKWGAEFELWAREIQRSIYEALDATPFMDFSKEIEELDGVMASLEKEVETATKAIDEFDKQTQEASKSEADLTEEVDDNTEAVKDNSKENKDLKEQLKALENQVEKVEGAYEDYTKALKRSVYLSALDNEEREVQIELQKGLEAQAKALGKTVEQLTEIEKKNVESFVRGSLTKIKQNEDEQRKRKDFTTETDRIIKESYEQTSSKIKQLEQAKQDYIAQARALGLEDAKATKDAELAYDKMITAEQIRINEEKHKEIIDATKSALDDQMSAYDIYQKGIQDLNAAMNDGIKISDEERVAYLKQLNEEYVDAMAGEYNDLYGLFEEKIKDMTGLSSKEFGIMEEIVQLTFGVNITDIIKGTFASAIQSILGFRTGGTQQLTLFGEATPGIFNSVGNTIDGTFLNTGLSAIGTFALKGLDLLGGLASDIFTLFGGVGSFLGDTFGGAFSTISSAIGALFDFGGSAVSGLGSAIGSFFGPVGSVVGGIVDFFFADGGYIAPGGVGIVGEAGPELVSGPAYVTSARKTEDMLNGGGSNVNVSFNIQAVDSRGIDQLLLERRGYITDLVRSAVEESPSRTIRGVA